VDRRVVVLEATGDGDANGATEVAKNALIDQQFCASGPK
jgi:hypothetical protein